MASFEGKVVIVTGASSGIGAATAIGFSKQGAKLTICGRNEKRLKETSEICKKNGAEVLEIIGDLREYSNIEPVIQKTVQKYSSIDILINNAGCMGASSIEDVSVDKFDDLYKILVRAQVFLAKFAMPHLKKTKGCIVNVSSVLGIRSWSFAKHVPYAMFKSALDHFTRGFAAECSKFGVRVNSINPGIVHTNIGEKSNIPEEEMAVILKHASKLHPFGFMQPETISDGILFLCSSPHITGIALPVDSGVLVS